MCNAPPPILVTAATRADVLCCVQVLGTAVLWGAGTALGEVPPYALSYHAAKAGKRSAEVEAMLGVGAAAASGSRGGGSVPLQLPCCVPGACSTGHQNSNTV